MMHISNKNCSLQNWYQHTFEGLLLKPVQKELTPYLRLHPNKLILQLNCLDLLKNLPLASSHKINICELLQNENTAVCAEYNQLPFPDECADIVIFPQIYNDETLLQLALTDCQRVLSGQGRLIILGINRWSLWGLIHLLNAPSLPMPSFNELASGQKIRHFIREMGMELVASKTFCFRPPLQQGDLKTFWFEKFCQLTFPAAGGIYLIVAKKSIISPIESKQQWKWENILSPKGFSEPSAGKVQGG